MGWDTRTILILGWDDLKTDRYGMGWDIILFGGMGWDWDEKMGNRSCLVHTYKCTRSFNIKDISTIAYN